MNSNRTFVYLSAILIVCTVQAMTAPEGGIFIPRNGGFEGYMGKTHIFIDATSGGAMEIAKGEWPNLERLARLEMDFSVKKNDSSTPVDVRQAFDRNPNIIFIEEGNDRTGVRIKFNLYDPENLYHGYAMTETWMYPTGEMFLTAAACFEDPLAHSAVTDAKISVNISDKYTAASPGTASPQTTQLEALQEYPFNDQTLPARHVLFTGAGQPPIGFFWRTGKMELFSWPSRRNFDPTATGAPSYYRWPTYLPQAFPKAFSGINIKTLEYQKGALSFLWLDKEQAPEVNPTFAALLRIAAPTSSEGVKELVDCERNLVQLSAEGGVVFADDLNKWGYVDNEGVYQVRKTENPMTVTLPADPQKRTICVKVICLDSHGAVVTKLDGKPIVPHLASEGGIVDDPLAPIREPSEGPADMAIVTAQLGDKPQTLTVSEEDGVQFVYQTRDDWRNVMCFSTKTGGRWSGFKFSLVDGRIRNMRSYGHSEWALTENLLTWFLDCGQSPVDMIDQIRDFNILKNGPDEVVFYYKSANANDRAQSEYTVRVPADSPAMQINVTAKFTVLEHWPYDTNQFFDVFPFRGVDPREWWYDSILWLTPDGRTKWEDTRKWTFEGDTSLSTITGDGFFALCSSDRGNMVMINKNFDPPLPVHYVICGNYIDYHMDVHFIDEKGEPTLPQKGFTMSVDYELALWGDGTTTREDIIEIGNKSLKAGRLVLPEQ
ncbi:MAG: hypothetical protein ABIH23_18665 [bacterium]